MFWGLPITSSVIFQPGTSKQSRAIAHSDKSPHFHGCCVSASPPSRHHFSRLYHSLFVAIILRTNGGIKNENIDCGVRGIFSRRALRFSFHNESHPFRSSLRGAKSGSVCGKNCGVPGTSALFIVDSGGWSWLNKSSSETTSSSLLSTTPRAIFEGAESFFAAALS